jgi:putative colanic acid biosynthesis UDP-glucose lipid carrier transferase
MAWITIVVVLIVFAFLTKVSASYSRQWLAMWAICGTVNILLFRIFFGQLLRIVRARGWNHRKIVIVGAGELGRSVARNLKEATWTGLDIAYFVDDAPELRGSVIDGIEVRGDISYLNNITTTNKTKAIDEIWIALPLRAENRVKEVLYILRHSTATIRFIPDIFGFNLLNHSITQISGIPVLDVSASPMVGLNRVVKAIEDRVIAAIILVLISPVLILIAVCLKMSSPGPILFKQKRHGWDGKTIKVYKFRSMVVHNECGNKVTQACKNDVRITKLGKFLRQTSLDELPQFFNVLQGRMSIVGPRPHAIPHNEEYKDQIEAYMRRHKVKPGITGWAQVNGFRGPTDTLEKMKKRIEYDLFYIENWSLGMDLKIIFLTLYRGFVHQNAH